MAGLRGPIAEQVGGLHLWNADWQLEHKTLCFWETGSGWSDAKKYLFLHVSQAFLERQIDLCLQIPLGLHSTNSHTLFSAQAGFCSLLIWRGSKVKFWPTLYSKGDCREKLQQPKEGQLHSRNNSSISTGNRTGTLGARCLFQTSDNFFSRAWSNSYWLPRKLYKDTSKEASSFKVMVATGLLTSTSRQREPVRLNPNFRVHFKARGNPGPCTLH